MTGFTAIRVCVLVSLLVADLGYLPGVYGIPADMQFSSDRAATHAAGSHVAFGEGTLINFETISGPKGSNIPRKRVDTTTLSNDTTSSSGNFSVQPAEFFPSSASSASSDFDPFIISEVPNFAADSQDSTSSDSASEPPSSSATISGTTWMYYLVCGSSTSVTLGEQGIWTTQGRSSSQGPAFSSNVIVNPGDDQGQNGPPPGSMPLSSSSSGPPTWKATIYPSASPGAGSAGTVATATSLGEAATRVRRDSGDPPCSYLKCFGASCVPVSTSSTSVSSTSSSSEQSLPSTWEPPCEMSESSDGTGFCICTNGVTISPSSGQCPWTVLPSQASTTTSTTSGIEYPFTTTEDGNIIECMTYGVNDYVPDSTNAQEVSYCLGSTAVISEAPTATIELGNSSVFVGGMTGMTLYSSVSGNLTDLCGGTTSTTACQMDEMATATLGPVEYASGDTLQGDGEILVSVLASNFSSNDMKFMMINTIASILNVSTSATSSGCWNKTIPILQPDVSEGHVTGESEHGTQTYLFCNTGGFFAFQYFSDAHGFQYINTYLQFQTAEDPGDDDGSEYDCEEAVDAMADLIQFIVPELAPEDKGFDMAAKFACEAAAKADSGEGNDTSNGLSGVLGDMVPLSMVIAPLDGG